MRRFWFALALMLLLALAGFGITQQLNRICQPIALLLEQAESATGEEAAHLCAAAREDWERSHKFMAAVTDHQPMEEVDALFDSLAVYLRCGDDLHFSQTCAQLASQIRAIAEAQQVAWWSVF